MFHGTAGLRRSDLDPFGLSVPGEGLLAFVGMALFALFQLFRTYPTIHFCPTPLLQTAVVFAEVSPRTCEFDNINKRLGLAYSHSPVEVRIIMLENPNPPRTLGRRTPADPIAGCGERCMTR